MRCAVGRRRGSDPHVAVTVAYASSCSSDSTPSLGTSICLGHGPKKSKKTKEKKILAPFNLNENQNMQGNINKLTDIINIRF